MTKIVVISDTHCKFRELKIPKCDLLIDCGDYSFRGTDKEIRDFYTWFDEQPAEHLVSVQGNHERGFEKNPSNAKKIINEVCPAVHLLHDSFVVLEDIKIYGSPFQPDFYNWAFQLPRGLPLKEKWDLILEDTDILVTHGAPYQILDTVVDKYFGDKTQVGDMDLRARVDKLPNLKYHFFGHLHFNGGQTMKVGNTIFGNAAVNNDNYDIAHKPLEIEYNSKLEKLENDCI